MKKSVLAAMVIIALLFGAVLLFPVRVECGVPGYTCAVAPDENGNVRENYDIEPVGSLLIESLTKKDFFLRYKRVRSVDLFEECQDPASEDCVIY